MVTSSGRSKLVVALVAIAVTVVGAAPASSGAPAAPEALSMRKLVGHWPLNGSAADVSGNGHDGKIHGATAIAGGISGGAYRFDGTDNITLGTLDNQFQGGPFSVSLWERTDVVGSPNDYRMLISKFDTTTGTGPFELFLGDGRRLPPPECVTGNGPGLVVWKDSTGIPVTVGTLCSPDYLLATLNGRDGRWHMVTFTASSDERALYFDGALIARTTDPVEIPAAPGVRVSLGGTEFSVSHPWIGALDDVWIFRRVLRPGEVRALYETRRPAA